MNVRDLAVKFTSYAHYIARLFHSQSPDAPEYLTSAAQAV